MNTYIIAEVGPNHNGSIDIAIKYIEALSKIGVDAVKFQLAVPENLYSKDAKLASYQKKNVNFSSPIQMSNKYQLSFVPGSAADTNSLAGRTVAPCSTGLPG